MNQEKIIAIIKKIREDNNLTQRKLANKLHVTYQAVSKWENGKSIPDIEMLKIISETFNIDINEFFDTKPKKHVSSLAFIITTMFIIAGVICCVLIFNNGSFNFKSANSGNIDFKITGSAAYDDDKTYIQITSVEYESDEDLLFESIKCSLYEEYDGIIPKEFNETIADSVIPMQPSSTNHIEEDTWVMNTHDKKTGGGRQEKYLNNMISLIKELNQKYVELNKTHDKTTAKQKVLESYSKTYSDTIGGNADLSKADFTTPQGIIAMLKSLEPLATKEGKKAQDALSKAISEVQAKIGVDAITLENEKIKKKFQDF